MINREKNDGTNKEMEKNYKKEREREIYVMLAKKGKRKRYVAGCV